MEKKDIQLVIEDSDIAISRKKDHIDLAFSSRNQLGAHDERFYYEPVLSGHPESYPITKFIGFDLQLPIWVSSMTGGTEKAGFINQNLARACGVFGMGMGLGSCRSLLYNDDNLKDFDVKHHMPEMPLFANLGIAQLEDLIVSNGLSKIDHMLDKLSADGLIIHINPLQEWLQKEGDIIKQISNSFLRNSIGSCQISCHRQRGWTGFWAC